MTSNQPKHIIEGFSDDIKSIAQIFTAAHPKHKLIDFLSVWDEQHMDCLFANRFDPRELLEAISEMNQTLTRVLTNPASLTDDIVKIVALYLLLCIHIKQPERFRSKFRWTCDDLITIEKWCNQVADTHANLDPKFALRQLKALRAFDLVEEHKIYGPSMIRRGAREINEIADQNNQLSVERQETIEFLESKIEPNFSELKSIHETYDQFRQALNLTSYKDIESRDNPDENVGVFLGRAASSVAEFKSSLN